MLSTGTITHDARGWPQLPCPKGDAMLWLGSRYWMCEPCHVIYVSGEPAQLEANWRREWGALIGG